MPECPNFLDKNEACMNKRGHELNKPSCFVARKNKFVSFFGEKSMAYVKTTSFVFGNV